MTLSTNMLTPNDWPDSLQSMKEFDTLLRCGICFEFIDTAMMVKTCSHNYCSLCIRQYLTFKTECPTCRSNAVEQELINNRLVDDVIASFLAARSSILKLCGQEQSNTSTRPEVTPKEETPISASVTTNKQSSMIGKMFSTIKSTQGTPKTTRNTQNTSTTPMPHQTPTTGKQSRKRSMLSSDSGSDNDFSPQKPVTKRTPRRGAAKKYVISDSADSGDSDAGDKDAVIICSDSDSDFQLDKSASSGKKLPLKRKSGKNKHENCRGSNALTASPRPKSTDRVTPDKTDFHSNSQTATQTDESKNSSTEAMDDHDTTAPSTSSSVHTPQRLNAVSGRENAETGTWWKSPPHPSSSSTSAPSNADKGKDVARVSCPVCGVSIPERTINLHLDQCLTRGEKKECLRSSTPTRRKQLPKLVYHLMSDADIRKRLGEVGLPTQGNKQKLVSLHKEYTLRYNSQCDSLNPKSSAEIVKEMLRADSAKTKVTLTSQKSAPAKLQVSKSSSAGAVAAAQKSYIQQHKEQFKALIADIRKREKENPSKPEIEASTSQSDRQHRGSSQADRQAGSQGRQRGDGDSKFSQDELVTQIVKPNSYSEQVAKVEGASNIASQYFTLSQESSSKDKAPVTSPDLLSDNEDTRDSFKFPSVPKPKRILDPVCKTTDSDSNICAVVPNQDDVSVGSSISSVTFFTQKSHPDRQVEFPEMSNDSFFEEESLMHYRFSSSQDTGVIQGVDGDGQREEAAGHIPEDGTVDGHMQEDGTVDGHMQEDGTVDGHVMEGEVAAGHMHEVGRMAPGHMHENEVAAGHIPDGTAAPRHMQGVETAAGHMLGDDIADEDSGVTATDSTVGRQEESSGEFTGIKPCSSNSQIDATAASPTFPGIRQDLVNDMDDFTNDINKNVASLKSQSAKEQSSESYDQLSNESHNSKTQTARKSERRSTKRKNLSETQNNLKRKRTEENEVNGTERKEGGKEKLAKRQKASKKTEKKDNDLNMDAVEGEVETKPKRKYKKRQ